VVSRPERINELVTKAKTLLNENSSKTPHELFTTLDGFMMENWFLSQSSRNDYLKSLRVILKKEFEMFGKMEVICNKCGMRIPRSELETHELIEEHSVNSKSPKLSPITVFHDVMEVLSGNEKKPVERSELISKLITTGLFTEESAHISIKKMIHDGIIYETKLNHYNFV